MDNLQLRNQLEQLTLPTMDTTPLPIKSSGITDNGDGTVTLYGRHATSYTAWRAIQRMGFKSSGYGAWGDGIYAALPDAKHVMSFYSNWSSTGTGECVHIWIEAKINKKDIHWIPNYDTYQADLNAMYDTSGIAAYESHTREWEKAHTVVVGFDNSDISHTDMVGQWRCPAELVKVVKVETPSKARMGYATANEIADYNMDVDQYINEWE